MGRRKLRMEVIKNEKARLMAFEKRKKSLEKAAYELSTLCGVDIGMIIYEPTQNNEPIIWPSNHNETVAKLIDSYKSSRSNHECRYRTYNLSAFFKDQTEKIEGKLKKMRKRKREDKYLMWDDRFNCLSQDEMKEFVGVLMAKIDAMKRRLNLIKGSRPSLLGESDVLMKPSVHESAVFLPNMVQQQQSLQYFDEKPNMGNHWMMMMNNGASCTRGTYGFDQNPGNIVYGFDENNRVQNRGFDENHGNCAYSFDGKLVQNCGFGTGMRENVGVRNTEPPMMSYYVPKVEPLMSYYYVPNVVQMPQSEQGLLMSSPFPQILQAAQEEDYVQRHDFLMKNPN